MGTKRALKVFAAQCSALDVVKAINGMLVLCYAFPGGIGIGLACRDHSERCHGGVIENIDLKDVGPEFQSGQSSGATGGVHTHRCPNDSLAFRSLGPRRTFAPQVRVEFLLLPHAAEVPR